MKNLITTMIVIFLLPDYSFAQAPDTMWTKTFGGSSDDWGISIQQTNDSGFIIAGFTSSFGAGNFDCYLIKTNSSGDSIWTKTFGGTDEDKGFSVHETNDEGFIIGGWTKSFGAGNFDCYLIKTNSIGDTIWTKTFGGTGDDGCFSVQQTADGGFIITGSTTSFGAGSDDVWLIKTDQNGDTLWTKTFGGTNSDGANYVHQTSDNGYIITGVTKSFGETWGDVWLIKTDESGNESWNKTYGGNTGDRGETVRQTADGGFIITGSTSSFGTGRDIWLIKTDQNGDTLWTKTFGGSESDGGASVQQTVDGGYIVLGYTSSLGMGDGDFWLIRTDENGNEQWNNTFGGISWEQGTSVYQTLDGGYIATGSTRSFGAGQRDVWLVKLGPDVVGIENEIYPGPISFNLNQNYPNPFNPGTTIKFSLPSSGYSTLNIINALGEEVAVLLDKELTSGTYEVEWNATGLPSGVYFYQLKTGSFVETRKMLLLK